MEWSSLSCPVDHTSPADTDRPVFQLHGEEFTRDPHAMYTKMRQEHGRFVPVELAPGVHATLVISYSSAVKILNDPWHFGADPCRWQGTVPADSPVLPMMGFDEGPRHATGDKHTRYRAPAVSALQAVDLHDMHGTVERISRGLVDDFIRDGSADLAAQYARPLMIHVVSEVIGCSPDVGQRVAEGMAARFDSAPDRAKAGMAMLTAALNDHIRSTQVDPRGDDITSRLIQHPTGLGHAELAAQLRSFYAAGVEAGRNLVLNALYLMLTDERFGGSLFNGTLSTRDALDEVLFYAPPMANFCTTYPRQPILIDDTWLPTDEPVVISIAACNVDALTNGGHTAPLDCTGNRAHLAFSTGPHACPARPFAYQIGQDAIDYLLDFLPEITLAVRPEEVRWRPGPFHRAVIDLPVRFPPSRSGVPTAPRRLAAIRL